MPCEGISEGSIQYFDGAIVYQADGLSFPAGKGFGWSHKPSYNNNFEDGDANSRNGWNWFSGVPELVDKSAAEIRFVTRAHRSSSFIDPDPTDQDYTYEGHHGVDAKIVHDTGSYEMVLHLTDGTQMRFYDFTNPAHGDKKGKLKSISDVYGNTVTTTYDGENRLFTLTDSGARTWVYNYLPSGVNQGRLEWVRVKKGGATGTTIAQIDFSYFDSTYPAGTGTDGDLMKIVVNLKGSDTGSMLGAIERTTMFRYWTGATGEPPAHKLQFIVGPQTAAEHPNFFTDPDTVVDDYADFYFKQYDTAGRVTEEVVNAAGCSCGGPTSGQGTFLYAYDPIQTTPPDYNTWKVSVTQTNPDGSTRIVDLNKGGAVLSSVFQPSDYPQQTAQRWITHYEFDSEGRVTRRYYPSACPSYANHDVEPSPTTGLSELFIYDTEGNLTEKKRKLGEFGSGFDVEKRTYEGRPVAAPWVYVPTSLTRFRKSGTTGETTNYSHVFYANDVAIQERTVQHPAVPATPVDENGNGIRAEHKYFFNTSGQLEWEKDEEGAVTQRKYESAAGQLSEVTVDVQAVSPPAGFESSCAPDCLNLTTLFTYDDYGRRRDTTDPEGKTERRHYTHLLGKEPVTLVYPHVVDGNPGSSETPVSISVYNRDGKLITTASGVQATADADLDDDLDEGVATLELAFQGTLHSRTEYVYTNGQMTAKREWTEAGNKFAEKYETLYGYNDSGRLARTKDPGGTITRHFYKENGQLQQIDIGTDDFGVDALSDTQGPYNMTTVELRFYDDEEDDPVGPPVSVGEGNVTRIQRFVDDTASRDIDYTYDELNRRITADGEEKFFQKWDYDNRDRVTAEYRHDGTEAGALLAKAETAYDTRGRVYRTTVHEVTGGILGAVLVTDFWYDGRGDRIKTRSPSGLFEKSLYDGAGRVKKTYVSYDTNEPTYSEALDVTDDIVIEQAQFDLDGVGNVILETRWERKSTGSTPGELTTASAERFYIASWYDDLHRLATRVDYGTNGGADLTLPLPQPPPARSDTKLRTDYDYKLEGHLEDITDPEGKRERRGYDELGRLTSVVDNFVDGTPGPNDQDRRQEIVYNGVSAITHRKVWMTNATDVQETEYVYGVAKGDRPDSAIASNNLLKTIKYPDPDATPPGSPSEDPEDQETFAYNAQGDLVYRKDQNDNVHEYEYDEIGGMTVDKVSTLGAGVDSTILRIGTTYDALDRVIRVTSYSLADLPDPLPPEILKNEVQFDYNGFGQVTESWQEHAGAVNDDPMDQIPDSLKVSYAYSDAEDGDPISRLTAIHQYPATNRTVYFLYDDQFGANDYEKLDWILGRVSAVSNNSAASSDRLADYTYQGLSRVVARLSQEQSGTAKDLKVTYTFDRFGRTDTLAAKGAGGTPVTNDFQYGYDRNSSVLWREEKAPSASAKDELYTYDSLDRLDVFKRGDLDSQTPRDIPAPVETRDWLLDLTGNWKSIDSETREHNRSNEITNVNQAPADAPSYDDNGNTTTVREPAPQNRTFTYDAWNRVVAASAVTYGYDGLHRRITAGGLDYYYSGWQLISERDSTDTDKEYVWGVQYIDEILSRDDDSDDNGTLDRRLYYVQDANWNVTALVDANGDPAERYLYDPYGLPSFLDGNWNSLGASAVGNRVLFTGRLWSSGTYTYDYRHREYSPYLGRFLQRDPAGVWADAENSGNGFAYAAGRPTARVDPSGLLSTASHARMTRDCCAAAGLEGCDDVCEKLARRASEYADRRPGAQLASNANAHCMARPYGSVRRSGSPALRRQQIQKWREQQKRRVAAARERGDCEELLNAIGDLLHHYQDCFSKAHTDTGDVDGTPATWEYDSIGEFALAGLGIGALPHLVADVSPRQTEKAKKFTCRLLDAAKDMIREACCPPVCIAIPEASTDSLCPNCN